MKLTNKQKEVLKQLTKHHCQSCNKPESETRKLEIHRLKRGNAGGEYIPSNLMVICEECHKNFHGYE